VTPATQGGKLPSPNRQLAFDSALDLTRAAGALQSLGLQLIESPVTDVSSDDSQSVVCALQFMDEDDLITSANETVSMGSTDTDSSLY
jgi:enhancing lycopene biosynthesis protein 2